jgi:ABC-type glutathione transport system ATPase component
VTHNLGVVARYANRIYIMYAGRIVEAGKTKDIFADPRHPYTKGLLRCIPRLDALEMAFGSRTRAVIINSPNNPTGVIYWEDVLHDLGASEATPISCSTRSSGWRSGSGSRLRASALARLP